MAAVRTARRRIVPGQTTQPSRGLKPENEEKSAAAVTPRRRRAMRLAVWRTASWAGSSGVWWNEGVVRRCACRGLWPW